MKEPQLNDSFDLQTWNWLVKQLFVTSFKVLLLYESIGLGFKDFSQSNKRVRKSSQCLPLYPWSLRRHL